MWRGGVKNWSLNWAIAMDDKTLAALLNLAVPPAQDWNFTLAVMARVEKRQFHRTMLINVALGVAVLLLLVFAAPSLAAVWAKLAAPLSNYFIIAGLVLAGGVLSLPWLAQQK